MNRRERGYIIAAVVLLIVLVIKSLVFDPVSLSDPSEVKFAQWVETRLDEEYSGTFFDSRIVVHRLVSVKTREEAGETLYVGKVRRYLLGVVPISEKYIKEKVEVFEDE